MEQRRLLLDLKVAKVRVELFDFLDEVIVGVVSDVVLGEVDGNPSDRGRVAFSPGVRLRRGCIGVDEVAGEASAGDAAQPGKRDKQVGEFVAVADACLDDGFCAPAFFLRRGLVDDVGDDL